MKKLFYFLSKTDPELIAHCGVQAKSQQIMKGVLILISGLFATLSAAFGLGLFFESSLLAAVFGVGYGLLIMSVFREVVSSATKAFALPALLLAIVMGIIISVPLELRLFEGRISDEILSSVGTISVRLFLILIPAAPLLVRLLEGDNMYIESVKKLQACKRSGALERTPEQIAASDINLRPAIPGFGRGFASAIDWAGALAPTVEELRGGDKTPDEADAMAMAGDWKAIGSDLMKVMKKYGAKSTRRIA
ncbi:MAG: DUF4407 domain-containing protein [Blastocatellia bacterium]|nr:DUF4407 domain-containing protein [Blastocatellia bacterium]